MCFFKLSFMRLTGESHTSSSGFCFIIFLCHYLSNHMRFSIFYYIDVMCIGEIKHEIKKIIRNRESELLRYKIVRINEVKWVVA